jgi:hypothetical protein
MRKEYSPNFKRRRSVERIENIKAEMERKFKEQYTFKPVISSKLTTEFRSKTPESKKEFFKRLAAPKISKLLNRSNLTQDCLEKPNATFTKSRSKSNRRNRDSITNTDANIRLYQMAKEIKQRKHSQILANEDSKYKGYTFRPLIDENSKKILKRNSNSKEKRPIYLRVIIPI